MGFGLLVMLQMKLSSTANPSWSNIWSCTYNSRPHPDLASVVRGYFHPQMLFLSSVSISSATPQDFDYSRSPDVSTPRYRSWQTNKEWLCPPSRLWRGILRTRRSFGHMTVHRQSHDPVVQESYDQASELADVTLDRSSPARRQVR